MSAKEKNEMIIPDSKVESLFVELENIFDNYDGYDRRLKAYEIINTALYQSEGRQQPSTESKCNKHIVSNSEVALIDFLIHLNDKGLINNHDFDYEKEAKKYIKKLINDC